MRSRRTHTKDFNIDFFYDKNIKENQENTPNETRYLYVKFA